jgi:nitroreductase
LTINHGSSSSFGCFPGTASASEMTLNDATTGLSLLSTRRSASVKAMSEPGPTPQQVNEILTIAVRVPDHGKLAPWRFILFEGDARRKFGGELARRWESLHSGTSEETLSYWRSYFLRAPTIIALVSRAAAHPKIPEWEQQLSAGAVGQNILLAASALGIGCQWNTDWCAYDEEIGELMKLEPHERIAGFFYLGTAAAPLEDRPRPDPSALLSRWTGP